MNVEFIIIFILIGFLIALYLVSLLDLLLEWQTHKEMVENTTERYGTGNYSIFIKEFKKKDWISHGWHDSFFNDSTNSQIHAGIIKFDGRGMILPYRDYLKVRRFLKDKIEKREKREKSIKWE